MPILKHEYAIPLEKNSIIWRYIDFWKYEAMLNDESLYFCRQDVFSDPFEGSLPKSEIQNRKTLFLEYEKISPKFNAEKGNSNMAEYHRSQKKLNYLNCWNINKYESAQMWKCYVKDNEGIAIMSTSEKIQMALKSVKENIGLSKIRYIDYDNIDEVFNNSTNSIDSYSTITPLFHKRIEFKDENEFRLYYQNDISEEESINKKGIKIKIDLQSLIEKIVLNPNANKEVQNKIKEITKKYHYDFKICNSKLKVNPFY